ncbi:hypothetical protein G3O08_10025 [Cryomorpha ignava]|uniref:DUF4270 domain-containing protein n=1 Tax=Cryomorpha ignava TaxID=101383 RepID=A0A7K3WQQ5_9FLAO|nr:hypothetical protein [Cryomorpha ignava]NEN23838.1 hypothetical protein [Cryomorpha ignava]
MKNSVLKFSFLFLLAALTFLSCKKDVPEPTGEAPATVIPEGGMISGVYKCCNQTVIDSFMMSDVTGRLTSQGGLSFIGSNDSYELLFFLPQVIDTGLYANPFFVDKYLKVIENGDTTAMYSSDISLHITQYHQFSNYTLISGTFEVWGINESINIPNGSIESGEFTNIPLFHNGSDGNYVIYQGEEADISTSKIMITDKMFFSHFRFKDEYIHSIDYGESSSGLSPSTLSSGTANSKVNITELNESESTVSGWIKTKEEVDLELHFQTVDYMSFPELEDGQMAVVFNFGEEILYFDSAKYVIPEFPSNKVDIYGYKGESTETRISVFYNLVDASSIQGQSQLYNTGLTYLESMIYGFSYLDFSSDNTKLSFEYGRAMGEPIYRQLCIKGKNIPIGM